MDWRGTGEGGRGEDQVSSGVGQRVALEHEARSSGETTKERLAVELVVGVEDEEGVEGAAEEGVGPVVGLGQAVHHVEEVARVGQVALGLVVWPVASQERSWTNRNAHAESEETCLEEWAPGRGAPEDARLPMRFR